MFAGVILSKFLIHHKLHCAHFGFETVRAKLNTDFIMLLRESVVLSKWPMVILGTNLNSAERDSNRLLGVGR